MPAHIINEGIVSGGMFIAIGESIIARVAALGGYTWISQTCELLMYLDIGEAPRYLRRMKILVYSFLAESLSTRKFRDEAIERNANSWFLLVLEL